VINWRKQQEQAQKQLDDLREIELKRTKDRKIYEEFRMKKLEIGMFRLKYGRYDFHVREKETEEYVGPPKVSFVVKADVDGSLDAILGCLNTYHSKEVELVIFTHNFLLPGRWGTVVSFMKKMCNINFIVKNIISSGFTYFWSIDPAI
jgi:hypothetical protein